MRLANRIPQSTTVANDTDPRDGSDAEIIDLAQRNAFPAVARPGGKSDAMGMVAGIAIVAGLGAITLWSMNSARLPDQEGVGGQQQTVAPPPVQAVAPPPVKVDPPTAAQQTAMRDPAPSPVYAAPPQPQTQAMGNPYNNPTVVFDAGANNTAVGPMQSVEAAEGAATAAPAGERPSAVHSPPGDWLAAEAPVAQSQWMPSGAASARRSRRKPPAARAPAARPPSHSAPAATPSRARSTPSPSGTENPGSWC